MFFFSPLINDQTALPDATISPVYIGLRNGAARDNDSLAE